MNRFQADDHSPREVFFKEYRMMTAVSVPAYDRKLFDENTNEVGQVRVARATVVVVGVGGRVRGSVGVGRGNDIETISSRLSLHLDDFEPPISHFSMGLGYRKRDINAGRGGGGGAPTPNSSFSSRNR